jgi:hypothetical protein
MFDITLSDPQDDEGASLSAILSATPAETPSASSIAASTDSDSGPHAEFDAPSASAARPDSSSASIEGSFECDAQVEAIFCIDHPDGPGAAAAPPPPPLGADGHDSRYRSWFCQRLRRPQFRAPLLFRWLIDGRNTYCAKTLQFQSKTTYISEGPEVHIKAQQYQWILRSSNHFCTFELFKRDEVASEMRVFITNDYGKEIGPRKFIIEIGDSVRLVNRIPRKKAGGRWVLNFSGKYVIKSAKNAIITDQGNHPVIIIRKIDKKTLQIETIRDYSDVQLFALGVISFICPI